MSDRFGVKEMPPASVSRGAVGSALAFVVIVALVTRAPHLLAPALWIDEAFSIFYAAKGVSAIWGHDWLVDPTPPAYYSLLSAWEAAFGLSEPVLRLLSLALTCVTAINISLAGRMFGSLRGGVAGALIWLLMPLNAEYSLEIRAYALELAVLSGLWLAAGDLLTSYEKRSGRDGVLMSGGALVTGLAVLAFYTHVTSVFPVAGVALAVLIAFVRKGDSRALVTWVMFSVAFVLCAAAQIKASYAVMRDNYETLAWLPAGTWTWMAWTARSLLLGEITTDAFAKALVFAAWALLSANGVMRLWRNQAAMTLLVVAPLIGFLFVNVASLAIPVLLPRTVLWFCIPLALLAGLGLARTPLKIAVPAMAAGCAGLLLLSEANMAQRLRWRSDHSWLAQIARQDPEAIVATVDGERACIMAYYRFFTGRVRLLDLGRDQAFQRTQNVALGCNEPPALRLAELRTRLLAHDIIWVVGSTDPGAERKLEAGKLGVILADIAVMDQVIDEIGFYAARFRLAVDR